MIKYDCHLHTSFSDDSEALPSVQIEEAIRRGMSGICITDHMDLDYPSAEEAGMKFIFDEDKYWQKLSSLREKYSDRIEVRIGMEVGLRNEEGLTEVMTRGYDRIIGKYPFDFIIGSTHCLEMTDPVYDSYWADKSTSQGLRRYFEAIRDNALNYDLYDTLGHCDYLVRYVPKSDSWHGVADYHPSEYMDIIDEFLRIIINKGKSLECNTAGIKYGLGFAHPHDEILTRYRELGGELLTIGSDGHKPEHICYDFDKTAEHLKSLGYRYYTVYKDRRPQMLEL